MSTIAAARAIVAELQAKQANLAARVAEAKAAREPIQRKLDAIQARRGRITIVVNAASTISRRTLADVGGEGYSIEHALKDKKPKEIVDAIASGGVKLSLGYGITYTARGLAGRIRIPKPDALRAWDRATKARRRAQAALDRAKAAESAAALAAFEGGAKITLDDLVADVAKVITIKTALATKPHPAQAAHELERLTDGQYGELSLAKRHLAHLTKRTEDNSCPTCLREKREADTAAAHRARVTALPRKRMTCPDHGPRLGYSERSERDQWVRENDGTEHWVANLPVLWCPVDLRRYVDVKQRQADAAKAAKPKRAKGRTVTFLCPNPECGETTSSAVVDDTVACEACEAEWDVNRVVRVKSAA